MQGDSRMQYTGLLFILFLPSVFLVNCFLPEPRRAAFLLLASWGFYAAWKPSYILIVVLLTVVDYAAGLAIERAPPHEKRRYWLTSIFANLSMLFLFKYLAFVDTEAARLFGWNPWLAGRWEILLPIGISIHTLQAMSYTTDVYNGQHAAERSFTRFALFVACFPQMAAGPIERAHTLLDQLRVLRLPSRAEALLGLQLVCQGLFKKIVIADNLAARVQATHAAPLTVTPGLSLATAYLFAVQLYCDFSGFIDIARGSSLLFGITLSQNFDRPFLASSIPQFWRRWHITLTDWFFEFVYAPLLRLVPNRAGTLMAAFAVFLLSGLWHGANWTFLAWGGLNGLAYCLWLLAGSWLQPKRTLAVWAGRLLVFHVVAFNWIFFRATSVSAGWELFRAAGADLLNPAALLATFASFGGSPDLIRALLGALLGLAWLLFSRREESPLAVWRPVAGAAGSLILVHVLGALRSETFIYFNF